MRDSSLLVRALLGCAAAGLTAVAASAQAAERAPVAPDAAREAAASTGPPTHWAFQPLARPAVPDLPAEEWPAGEIDRFVLRRLRDAGLDPAPPADRATLIRRASFDLCGLPPSPAEVKAFVEDDAPDEGAFAEVVDRLLASPHYGERWGRHWLDLARYSDSNGLDENLAIGHAWRYRDWVVRAFNEDLPYDRFVTEQLAGDLLPEPADHQKLEDQLVATGFLSLGPKMLAEQDKVKLVRDIVDEQIDVTCRAFLGLTVSCARCHDHKFDPIPTRDYYALAGVFVSTSTMAELGHVSRWRELELATDAERAARKRWENEHARAAQDVADLERGASLELQRGWRRDFGAYLLAGTRAAQAATFIEAEGFSRGNLKRDSSQWGSEQVTIVHTREAGVQFAEYDVTVPAGGRFELHVRYAQKESRPMRILLDGAPLFENAMAETTGDWFPADQRWLRIGALALRPGRNVLRLERAAAVPHVDKLLLVPLAAGETESRWPISDASAAGLVPDVVRSTADFLERTERRNDPVFAPWHAFAALPADTFADRAGPLAAELCAKHADGALALSPLARSLLDGLTPTSLRELAGRYQTMFAVVDRAWQRRLAEHARRTAEQAAKNEKKSKAPTRLADAEQEELRQVLYGPDGPLALPPALGETFYPDGIRKELRQKRTALAELKAREPKPFDRAIGVRDGEVRDLPVHIRGSHLTLGASAVPRGALHLFDEVTPLPAIGAAESGRLQVARWLTDPEHPLTARVAVNRIWQGHFGRGIVRTPSNFGMRGDPPTHPELLDWLARRFVEGGWSQKAMHRRIMLSQAYRMQSRTDPACAAVDPENRLLWRMNRRRLEAEPLRDAILAVSGALDETVGGSLLETKDRGYVTNDQSGNQARYDTTRRSIYLPVIRNAVYDLFTIFDFNDPSVPVARRPETTVASQALWLMNSPFVLEHSERFAARLLDLPVADDHARIDEAFVRAYARPPTDGEARRALAFLERLAAELEDAAPAALAGAGEHDDARPSAAAEPARAAPSDQTLRRKAWQSLCQVLFAGSEFLYVD